MNVFLLFFFVIIINNCFAETSVFFQNNTPLAFSVATTQTGTHILSSGEWAITSNSVSPWQGHQQMMWTNRNTGIHNGDDFYFDIVLTNGSNTVTLKLKLRGTFTGSNMWVGASGLGFSHPWYSDNNFHQATFVWGAKTYTLKYHSYFTGGFDDVYFALQEHNPFPLNSTDTSNPNVLNILAYNIYMLTPPAASTDQGTRALALPNEIRGYDAIIFSEAFYNSARTDLKAGIASEYPYQTDVVDSGTFNDDGGVFIASRFPILNSAQIVYNDCNGTDCLAAKGVMYAKINKYGRIFHLFGTHTQAWPDPIDVTTRILQFKQLQNFITSLNIPSSEAVLIGGDLNVDMIANNMGEYDGMLDSLNLMEPIYTGHPYSYDGSISYYASPGVEYLDYVMTQNHHLNPIYAENEVLILRSIDDDMFNMFDLSDHLAVRGHFVFPLFNEVTEISNSSKNIKVYPNPNNGVFTLELEQLIDGNVEIFNALGQLVFQQNIYQQKETINLNNFATGVYYLQVNSNGQTLANQKIVLR